MTIKLSDEILESGMRRQDVDVRSFAVGDALRSEIEHFIGHVRMRTRPIVSGHEGRRALDVALQVMDQIKEHQNLEVFKKVSEAFAAR